MKTHGIVIYNLTKGTETVKLFNTLEEANNCLDSFRCTIAFLKITDNIETYHFTINTKE